MQFPVAAKVEATVISAKGSVQKLEQAKLRGPLCSKPKGGLEV